MFALRRPLAVLAPSSRLPAALLLRSYAAAQPVEREIEPAEVYHPEPPVDASAPNVSAAQKYALRGQVRRDWVVEEVREIYNSSVMDLIYWGVSSKTRCSLLPTGAIIFHGG
jgi:hypothetical protein